MKGCGLTKEKWQSHHLESDLGPVTITGKYFIEAWCKPFLEISLFLGIIELNQFWVDSRRI